MSSIRDDLARAHQAFTRPALSLLRRPSGPLVVAVLTCAFGGQRHRIPVERFHAQVAGLLGELSLHGHEVPDTPARDLVRGWVREQWLSLTPVAAPDGRADDRGEEQDEGDGEEYALTSHAQDAMDHVARVSGERVLLGESRIRTVLDTARRCALEATPDRDRRVQRLEEQIAALSAERDRLLAGEDVPRASDERMLGQYLDLADLLSALPGDFLRVSEEVRRIHREVVGDFRAEQRPTGEVLEDYLRRAEELLTGSVSGRAFAGAVELARDEDTLRALQEDLATILEHGFAAGLTPEQRTALRTTPETIGDGIELVLEQRRRLSASLRSHILRHDPLRDRELDEALRAAAEQLTHWIATTGPRAAIDLDSPIPSARIAVTTMRTRLHDPADDTSPPPLRDHDETAEGSSLEELRRFGGPDFERLRTAVTAAAGTAGAGTAAVFDDLPDDLRRPADLMGLLHLAVAAGGADPATTSRQAVYTTSRPDGTVHRFLGPDLSLDPEQDEATA
ncbi:DUF3375 family protein [Kineococcus aurantiacus]|uniref:DUF3375 domain-containing protein n=1 Tax=Kineococcus aurantiacus TaxID=37633 RepID=A0A7Y9DPS7_9ACTN|nr:DUF3375 family protein [Kineococcus aurantiacus]NYD24482.1 hypothetical protein [Kineococcus aurantiacus]